MEWIMSWQAKISYCSKQKREEHIKKSKKAFLKTLEMKVNNCPWDHRVAYDLTTEQDIKETPFMKGSSHDPITF